METYLYVNVHSSTSLFWQQLIRVPLHFREDLSRKTLSNGKKACLVQRMTHGRNLANASAGKAIFLTVQTSPLQPATFAHIASNVPLIPSAFLESIP